ncbi:MAG: glutamine amidotransferase [Candidatus Woykebacteria bacterium RBG_13_40_15]|uniref:Lipid II isoglutaminyl synthase (glutamine-hydrolyzing) subunit GatD n=1 Tax=Candidatus Woykebacteria bacterium RBG_13_40_15 TaxID=1802593 RepID=A0A1G1W7H0_9BACT|nr:MAG: glutamine amidotransferase [Candidatus Woykebacteria bacterium RBG_13_40_15]
MSTYGDRGNILTLWQRCRWRGIEVTVKELDMGDKINPAYIDLYFFGGGQDQAQKIISEDLQKVKRDPLRKAARLGSVFLGICGGFQLFGHYYRPANEMDIPGIGILDIVTIAGNKRMIGNIVAETNEKLNMDRKLIVGFENHSGKTYLGKRAAPLGNVVVGFGNNGEDRTEGAYQGNVFGCYLHGPLLPKNPQFADLLIERALERKYGHVVLEPIDDSLELETQESVVERAKKIQ